MSEKSNLDKVLDQLPYADGSARRRLVAGGLSTVGVWLVYRDEIAAQFADIGLEDVLTTPTLAIALVLVVYALGTIVEMFGDLFLVRAASGVYWAISYPRRVARARHWALRPLDLLYRYLLVVPLHAARDFVRGLLGSTPYRIDLNGLLSPEARSLVRTLPKKAVDGLRCPVGDSAELALKFVVDGFDDEQSKKWARRLISRVKDVSVTTTALLLSAVLFLTKGFFVVEEREQSVVETELYAALDSLQKNIDMVVALFPEGGFRARMSRGDFSDEPPWSDEISWSGKSSTDILSSSDVERIQNAVHEIQPARNLISAEQEALDALLASTIDYLAKLRSFERDQSIDLRSVGNTAVQAFMVYGILLPFWLLYAGFFARQRNSIVSMLEAIAFSKHWDVGVQDPPSTREELETAENELASVVEIKAELTDGVSHGQSAESRVSTDQ